MRSTSGLNGNAITSSGDYRARYGTFAEFVNCCFAIVGNDHDMREKPTRTFYLSRLSQRELETLLKLLTGIVGQSIERGEEDPLGQFLFDEVEREFARRTHTDPPADIDPIIMPVWSGRRLALALKRATILSYIGLPEGIASLCDWCVSLLTARAGNQLTTLDENYVEATKRS